MMRLRAFLQRMLPVAALVTVCMAAATVAATLAIVGSHSAVLEASVSSRIPVDYSADQVALKIPRLSPEIIEAIRGDRDASSSDSGARDGPASETPAPGTVATPAPSNGATPPPNTGRSPAPTPVLPLPTPVPTPSLPTVPPIPTPLPIPTPPPLSTSTLPPLP